jgi:hypothetical protein
LQYTLRLNGGEALVAVFQRYLDTVFGDDIDYRLDIRINVPPRDNGQRRGDNAKGVA